MIISISTPNNNNFNYHQCRDMYNQYKHLVQDDDFDDIIKRTFFYSFYVDKTLIGCIYYYYINGKLFVNAFASRKHHLLNLECLRKSLEWFDCDIYAEGSQKTSRLCLLKCNFKRLKDNLFIYRR